MTYLVTFIALILIMQLYLAGKFSAAAQVYRLSIVRRYKQLKENDAPAWLLDMWGNAIGNTLFSTGMLRRVIIHLAWNKKSDRAAIATQLRKVHALPADLRAIHDKMDKELAMVLAMNAPYTVVVLSFYTVMRSNSLELAKIIPHRDARGSMVLVNHAHTPSKT
ncbi:MAG: hypothetical protein Q9M26_04500 [Mariprofundales bacterium]|nr:hypothetical protein [Mariprofundales bacterium]